MVGFGSSLRMGRRTGWEAAYLDYETLKLLLSQIEAVYEEQTNNNNNHHQHSHEPSLSTSSSLQQRFRPYQNHHHHDGGGGGNSGGGNNRRGGGTAASDDDDDDEDDINDDEEAAGRQRRRRERTSQSPMTMDYRDQLFLESDSDAAFASDYNLDPMDLMDEEKDEKYDEYDEEEAEVNNEDASFLGGQAVGGHDSGGGGGGSHGCGQQYPSRPHHRTTESGVSLSGLQPQQYPFLTYSTQAGYASSEDSEYDSTEGDRCAHVPWRTAEKKPSSSRKKKKNGNSSSSKKPKRKNQGQHQFHHHHRNHNPTLYDEDDYFPTHRPVGPDTFIIAEEGIGYVDFGGSIGSGGGGGGGNDNRSSSNNMPRAQTSLLPPSTTATHSLTTASLSSEGLPMDDAAVQWDVSTTIVTTDGLSNSGLLGFVNTITGLPSSGGILPPASSPANASMLLNQNNGRVVATGRRSKKRNKREEARRRARRQRRRRRLARLRKERDKKVPPPLRIAHAKSRAIAERFLGLLRAEVEKVVLFAQARLGELADTAGGLRFMSTEDLTEMGEQGMSRTANSAAATAYDYPFSDGGLHPSASSSSDEGMGTIGGGAFPWSDSSSDEGSKASVRPRIGSALPSAASLATSPVKEAKGNRRRPITENQEKVAATIRKIQHFEDARRERPIFNRDPEILGDELLLMSAVDEADAYAAVGVELLHVLRFICINTIAVRKVIRKHDRLLMNRMLGGYYHRERTRRSHEEITLGGLVAHVAGDVYEAHPALVNHGKLTGVFDLKVQQLANSRTVKVVSSCLALALSEYEVSRNRADALAKLNPTVKAKKKSGSMDDAESKKSKGFYSFGNFSLSSVINRVKGGTARDEGTIVSSLQDHDLFVPSDDESGSGPPSTTSSLSLSRLQYTVLTISALREAARSKANPYSVYMSRASLSFTGQATVGAGLDGCSRETLDALLDFNPDAALLLDSSAIYAGLKYGQWRHQPIESVMASSLAVALTFPSKSAVSAPVKISPKAVHEKESVISSSLSILPKKSEEVDPRSPFDTACTTFFFNISRFVPFPSSLLRANRLSSFLYTMNYFLVHATAVPFVIDAAANSAYSAIIIGAPTISAILVSLVHCHILSDYTSMGRKPDLQTLRLFRILFFFSAFAAVLGNIVQAQGTKQGSIPQVVFGRFILGFAASDIVQRQFASSLLPLPLIPAESARLIYVHIVGQVVGLLLGSLVAQSGAPAAGNWLMASFWILYAMFMASRSAASDEDRSVKRASEGDWELLGKDGDVDHGDGSDSSGSDQGTGGPARLFQGHPCMRGVPEDDEDEADETTGLLVSKLPSERQKQATIAEEARRPRGRLKRFRTFTKRIRKLLAYNISIPIALALILYCKFSSEAFVSSSPLLGYHYFDWTGPNCGCFLAFLSALVVPTDLISERVARRYEERTVIKRGIVVLGAGLLVMVNWGSIFGLLPDIKNLLDEDKTRRRHEYDWFVGVFQYVVGIIVTFVTLRSIDVASCSLLSKVSPPHLRSISINVGTIVTFLGLAGQLAADLQIAAVVLSHKLINSDVVNALVIPILLVSFLAYYFVRRHFFFLM